MSWGIDDDSLFVVLRDKPKLAGIKGIHPNSFIIAVKRSL